MYPSSKYFLCKIQKVISWNKFCRFLCFCFYSFKFNARHAFQFFSPLRYEIFFQNQQLNSHKRAIIKCFFKNTEATIKRTNCYLNWASKVPILILHKIAENGNEECDKSWTNMWGKTIGEISTKKLEVRCCFRTWVDEFSSTALIRLFWFSLASRLLEFTLEGS